MDKPKKRHPVKFELYGKNKQLGKITLPDASIIKGFRTQAAALRILGTLHDRDVLTEDEANYLLSEILTCNLPPGKIAVILQASTKPTHLKLIYLPETTTSKKKKKRKSKKFLPATYQNENQWHFAT